MSDKVRAFLLLDYFREILPSEDADGNPVDIASDLAWYNKGGEFHIRPEVHTSRRTLRSHSRTQSFIKTSTLSSLVTASFPG